MEVDLAGRRNAMPYRLFASLLLVVPLAWAPAQDTKESPAKDAKGEPSKYEEVLQKLVETMGKMTKTLALVVDEETAKSNRSVLKEHAAAFIEARKQSQSLAPPSAEAKEKLAKKFRPEIEKSQKQLVAEVARVQRVPGGNAALQEIRGVFEKKEK
jgi:hypothetical protein